MKAKTFKIVSFSVIGVIAAIFLALTIACGVLADVINNWAVKPKVEIDSSTLNAQSEAGEALAAQIEREGIVLVRNEGNTLPLSKTDSAKVNVFGWSSVQWITGGSGSGQVKSQNGNNIVPDTDLYAALESYGLTYNTELKSMYERYLATRPYMVHGNGNGDGALHTYNYDFSRLYEPSINDTAYYSNSLKANAEAFSETALVVIGRVSGESNDSPSVQYKGTATMGQKGTTDTARHYLEISSEEEALLTYVGENYSKVVVIINAVNTMELGFLETIPGLKSCIVVGGTGVNAATAIPEILYGERTYTEDDEEKTVKVSPSGKLTDTYAYALESNPSFINAGENGTSFYTGASGLYPLGQTSGNFSSSYSYEGVAYMDYTESIYVGYKWYETAFADKAVINANGVTYDYSTESNYRKVVQYPFGYGLSYSNFSYEIDSVSPAAGSTVTDSDKVEIVVTVTNNGDYPAKDVVQAYYTAPYTSGGIEKAAVNLVAFAKTQEIAPNGGKQSVLLSFDVSDMASYDCFDKNGNGFTGYELDAGTYQIKLMSDSHTALEIADSSVGHKNSVIEYDIAATRIDKDPVTKKDVYNKYTGSDAIDGVSVDGNGGSATGNINYLTRANLASSFPASKGATRAMTEEIRKYNLFNSSLANEWEADNLRGYRDTDTVLFDQKNGAKLYENNEVTELGLKLGNPATDWDDEDWDRVLDNMTETEMRNLVLHGYTQTVAVSSIGKPQMRDWDGPSQAGSFTDLRDSNGLRATGFPNLTVVGQTFNKSLAYDLGVAMGKDATARGARGLYAPGVNIHRSPFGGRNFEYYSEDPYLSGIMAAQTIKGAKNAGVYMYLKHLALYEQESLRDSIYVWVNEQALREIYLKPFQIAIEDGGATAIMSSYGRIGAVWSGGSEATLTGVLRDEWDFKGCVITDYSDHQNFMNGDQMVRAGGDLWMDGYNNNGSFTSSMASSNAFKHALRDSAKHILYMTVNADYTVRNPVDSSETIPLPKITPGFPWWIPVLVVADVLAFGGCGVWAFFAIKKKDPAVAEATAETTTATASDNTDEASDNSDEE